MAVLTAPAIFAGDEDMSPNAYHIFDPETGYMITVESQPDGQQGQSGRIDTEELQDNRDTVFRQSGIYLLALLLLAVGITAWFRKKRQSTM